MPLTIVERLIAECKIKNAYATVSDENIDSSLFREKPVNVWDAFIGKYPVIDDIVPVDRAYENPISQFSVEILHQIARNGNWDFEKRVNLYYTNLKYWDNFLETRKISCVVFSTLPHEIYDYIIYLLCKKKKIKTCMSFPVGYKYFTTSKAYYMFESIDNHTIEVRNVLKKYQEKYKDKQCKDIILSEYDEHNIAEIKTRFTNAENIEAVLMNQRRIDIIKHHYGNPRLIIKDVPNIRVTVKKLLLSCYGYALGRRETKKLVNKYESIAIFPDFSDKYIFYALHYQPEATSSPLGGMYANQLLAIQLIAHNLPEGYWLYVKEHPHQTSFGREASYYEALNKIPRVKIISQKVASDILIKNAIAVASLTGTVLFEAQVIQKPCLCLGHTRWEVLNGIYKINTNEECKNAIDEIIAGRARITTEKELRLFLLAMDEVCFDRANEEEYYNKLLQYINDE